MKPRDRIWLTAGLIAAALAASAIDTAMAQQVAMQPPFFMPGVERRAPGLFYFSAGVRYRNIQAFRLNKEPDGVQTGRIGTVPFGPDDGLMPGASGFGAPIPFGTGTQRPGFVGGGEVWTYDNGEVNSNDPCTDPPPAPCGAAFDVTCTPPAATTCHSSGSAWPNANPVFKLGRSTIAGDAVDGACCPQTTVILNAGSFAFLDSTSQANSASIAGTTAISWDLILTDSLLLQVNRGVFNNLEFRDKVLCPAFEVGLQWSDFFDVFGGFSFFDVGHSVSKSFLYQAQMNRRALQDTFPFTSLQDGNWPVGGFGSASTIIGGAPITRYVISPDGIMQGLFPTRTFSTVVDPSVTPENLQEVTSFRADFNVYEFRVGGRSWVPLFGLGRAGISLGTLTSVVYYHLSGTTTITGLGPNFTNEIVFNEIGNQFDWRPSYGAFVGTDLEVDVPVSFASLMLKASAEYSLSSKVGYQLMSIDTEFSPGGFQASFLGGLRF